MTYQERRARGICTTPLCKKKPARGCRKCAEHLAAARAYFEKRHRAAGMRTQAEYVAATEERRANGLRRSPFTDEALALVPVCACGIRHVTCDMPQRRQEILTAGLGGWA